MVNSAIEIRKHDIMYLINAIGSNLSNKQKVLVYESLILAQNERWRRG